MVPCGGPVARVSTVFTGSGDARARAFDAQSGALQRVFRGHAFVINCIQVGAPGPPGPARRRSQGAPAPRGAEGREGRERASPRPRRTSSPGRAPLGWQVRWLTVARMPGPAGGQGLCVVGPQLSRLRR